MRRNTPQKFPLTGIWIIFTENWNCTLTLTTSEGCKLCGIFDLCNLNRTVYMYVFSSISLFLYTITHLTGHRGAGTAFRFFTIFYYNSLSLIHTEFCMTRVATFIFYDSHTLSLHIVATSLKNTLKKIVASTVIWTPDLSHPKQHSYPAPLGSYTA
jgi:hypothetical protein